MKFFNKPYFIAALLCIVTLVITLQSLRPGTKTFTESTQSYTHYNNYVIFKQSFFHLIENKDLYILYPEEHWDLYKYSPTFALFMAPMAFLPDGAGLFIWNFLNVFALFFALWKLFPFQQKHWFLFVFVLIELITSIQNSQSNALIAGLIMLAFTFLEKKNIAIASLLILSTVFIKLFGLVAFALFIFYPNKLKAILYTIGWAILLLILPLIVISPSQLIFLYESWFNLLKNDHSASLGLSVAAWLYSWFGIIAKNTTLIFGGIIFCLPLLRVKLYKFLKFRLLFLASILIWVVIFNHKAESPTFVIAASGIVIWFASQKFTWLNFTLLMLAFIFTVLLPTDIFPKVLRDNYAAKYAIKAVPCIFIWFKIIYDMLFYNFRQYEQEELINAGPELSN